jgi:hypothetical protein
MSLHILDAGEEMWGHLRSCNHTLDSPACFKQRLTVAAWTPKAGGLAAQSVSKLLKYASPVAGSVLEPASPTRTKRPALL